MDHISDSLQKRLNQRSLSRTAQAAYVCHVAAQGSAGRYTVVSFNQGTLTLAAVSAAAAHDLKLSSESIRTRVEAVVGQPIRLRVVVARPLREEP